MPLRKRERERECTATTNYNLQIKRALSTINLHLIRAARVLFLSVSVRRIAIDDENQMQVGAVLPLHQEVFCINFPVAFAPSTVDRNGTETPNAHRNDVYFSIITTHQEHEHDNLQSVLPLVGRTRVRARVITAYKFLIQYYAINDAKLVDPMPDVHTFNEILLNSLMTHDRYWSLGVAPPFRLTEARHARLNSIRDDTRDETRHGADNTRSEKFIKKKINLHVK